MSVVAKAYLNEAGTDEAIELLTGRRPPCAPQLIQVEVVAAVCGNVRKGVLSAADAEGRCRRWLAHLDRDHLRLHPDTPYLDDAARLAIGYGHPVQDFVYSAMANRLGLDLITADRRFHDKVVAAHPRVSLLPGSQLD